MLGMAPRNDTKLWQGSGWLLGKGSSLFSVVTHGTASHSSGHGPKLSELKEHTVNALTHRVWILDGAMWSQELESMVFVGSLPLWDKILWFYTVFTLFPMQIGTCWYINHRIIEYPEFEGPQCSGAMSAPTSARTPLPYSQHCSSAA